MRFGEGRYRFDREIVRAFETERSVEIPVPLSSTLRLRSNRGSSGRRVPWRISTSAAPARRSLEVLLVGISRASPRSPRSPALLSAPRGRDRFARASRRGTFPSVSVDGAPRDGRRGGRARDDGARGPRGRGALAPARAKRRGRGARTRRRAPLDDARGRRLRAPPPPPPRGGGMRGVRVPRLGALGRGVRPRRALSPRTRRLVDDLNCRLPTTRLRLVPVVVDARRELGARRARATAEPPRTRSRPPRAPRGLLETARPKREAATALGCVLLLVHAARTITCSRASRVSGQGMRVRNRFFATRRRPPNLRHPGAPRSSTSARSTGRVRTDWGEGGGGGQDGASHRARTTAGVPPRVFSRAVPTLGAALSLSAERRQRQRYHIEAL